MIAQNGESTERGVRQSVDHFLRPFHLLRPLAGHEIAGKHDRIGRELGGQGGRAQQIVRIDDRPDVQVAQPDQSLADQRLGQSGYRQPATDDFHPVRLHATSASPGARRGNRSARGRASEKPPSGRQSCAISAAVTERTVIGFQS